MTDIDPDMIRAVMQILRSQQATSVVESQSQQPQSQQTQQPPATLFDRLAEGQVVQATVVSNSADGKVMLRLLGETVPVQTDADLKTGQRLTLVVSSKTDSIMLQVQQPPSQADIKAQFLKINLPLQQPVAELMKVLDSFTQSIPNRAVSDNLLLASTRQLTTQLLEQLPSLAQLRDPARFEQALRDSGLFLENRLARGEPPASDLKTALLRIATQLRPAVGQGLSATATTGATPGATTGATLAATSPAASNPLTTATASPGSQTAPGTSPADLGNRPAGAEARPVDRLVASADGNKTVPPTLTTGGRADASARSQASPGGPAVAQSTGKLSGSSTATTSPASMGANAPASSAANPAAGAAGNPSGAVGSPGGTVERVTSVTDKATLTATQAAQKARMLSQAEPRQLIRSLLGNLPGFAQLQAGLQLMPKTELQLLVKQLLMNPAQRSEATSQLGFERLQQLTRLLRSVESGIARIQTQQLASVPQDDGTRQVWQLELPFKDTRELQAVMLRIEQDQATAGEDENGSSWTMALNLDIGKLGHVHSKVRLTQEHVSTHFWSEQPGTAEKISTHLPRLQAALEKLGLKVNQLTSSLGRPPDPVEMTYTEQRLLDENA